MKPVKKTSYQVIKTLAGILNASATMHYNIYKGTEDSTQKSQQWVIEDTSHKTIFKTGVYTNFNTIKFNENAPVKEVFTTSDAILYLSHLALYITTGERKFMPKLSEEDFVITNPDDKTEQDALNVYLSQFLPDKSKDTQR